MRRERHAGRTEIARRSLELGQRRARAASAALRRTKTRSGGNDGIVPRARRRWKRAARIDDRDVVEVRRRGRHRQDLPFDPAAIHDGKPPLYLRLHRRARPCGARPARDLGFGTQAQQQIHVLLAGRVHVDVDVAVEPSRWDHHVGHGERRLEKASIAPTAWPRLSVDGSLRMMGGYLLNWNVSGTLP